PRWTSISVLSIRSKADFIIRRISPLRSSIVLASPAISLASCSARERKEASMRQSPVQEKELPKLAFHCWLTQDYLQGQRLRQLLGNSVTWSSYAAAEPDIQAAVDDAGR